MKRKVVVENTLTSHIDYLENSGYDVHKLYKNENVPNIVSSEYDGIVISNKRNIPSGVNGTPVAPIIQANGKTPEEVLNCLRTK